MKNKSLVSVISFAKNDPYDILLHRVTIEPFQYGPVLTIPINGFTMLIKLWKHYYFCECLVTPCFVDMVDF